MLRRFMSGVVSLLLLLLVPLSARAADPITAHVMMPSAASRDPVSLGRSDASGRTIAENLFVGLTRYNPVSGQIEHGLAEDWTVSDDKLTWTFKLRTDIQWVSYDASNGQVHALRPVVAGDFLYAIRRACEPASPNPAAHTIYVIAGCRNVATANSSAINDLFIARELRVQALSDQTLEIKLAFTAPNFPVLLSLPEFRPVPREAVEKAPDWTKLDTILTNGPFALAEGAPDQPSMTLIRNPLWPDKVEGNVERVAINFNMSGDTVSQQVTAGTVDFAVLDASTAVALKQSKPDVIQSAPGQTVTVLGFSAERPFVQKAAFRQALSLAIDRDSVIKSVLPDVALPMSRFTPPGSIDGPTSMPADNGFHVDGAKAAMFAGAGYNSCVLGTRLQLWVDAQNEALAKALVAQWQTSLSCNPFQFIIKKVSTEALQNVAHGTVNTNDPNALPRPEMWIYWWSPDYPDANAWTGDAIHCQYGFLRTGVACGEGDALIDQAFLETDNAKRADLYNRAEESWFGPQGTFPVAPLYISINYVAQQPWLKGATVNGLMRFDLWTLSERQ